MSIFADAGTLLHQAERGASVSVKGNNFSIKYCGFCFDKFRNIFEFGELSSQIILCRETRRSFRFL